MTSWSSMGSGRLAVRYCKMFLEHKERCLMYQINPSWAWFFIPVLQCWLSKNWLSATTALNKKQKKWFGRGSEVKNVESRGKSQVYQIMQIRGDPLMHPGHYQTPKAGISVWEDQAGTPLFTSLHRISLACSCRRNPEDAKIKPVSFVVKLITFSTSLRKGRRKPRARKSHLSNLTNTVFSLSQLAN